MNKNDLKKVIKSRIANQKEALEESRPTGLLTAQRFFKQHAPHIKFTVIDDHVDSIDHIGDELAKQFYTVNDSEYSGFGGALSALRNTQSRVVDALSSVFDFAAANGSSWKTDYQLRKFLNYPISKEIEAIADDLTTKYYDQRVALDKLELELLSVVTAAKSAKAATETLDELGITLDIPEAKQVQSNLPAVVQLSVPTTLFNKDIKKEGAGA
ncbi:hypothetical protein NST83_01105 [Paenibacillus sp. FSL R10-2782]|uniref:hypothetical protein n=1 Tax=Paenibacillus sp. FSL R10-2782 TaxID=2954661 RepID=UPI003158B2EF